MNGDAAVADGELGRLDRAEVRGVDRVDSLAAPASSFLRHVEHRGSANAAAPHLHFAINQMAPGERWWQGTAINPYPLLAGKKASG